MSNNLPIHVAFGNKLKALYGKTKMGTSRSGTPIKSSKGL